MSTISINSALRSASRGLFAVGGILLLPGPFLPWIVFHDAEGTTAMYGRELQTWELALCGLVSLALTFLRRWPPPGIPVIIFATLFYSILALVIVLPAVWEYQVWLAVGALLTFAGLLLMFLSVLGMPLRVFTSWFRVDQPQPGGEG
jgi:peptidoglycan/LPS O-acetylase OafA/YrhL